MRPRQDGCHFPDDIFLNENEWHSIKISLKFVPKVPINNIPALVPIMAWRRPGDKPLSEPMMVSLLTHICVTWPQWVKACQVIKLTLTRITILVLYNFKHWGRDKMADISQKTFSNAFSWKENVSIPNIISLKFVPMVPINNIPALVPKMAWCHSGDKPLSEPMTVSLLTNISASLS